MSQLHFQGRGFRLTGTPVSITPVSRCTLLRYIQLENLLDNGNKVDIYTGTLNCFNSPYNMQKFAKISEKNPLFNFYVNFDSASSTHWKVYTINDKILYVGSANFTSTGISLKRDTLLKVCKHEVCEEYLEETKKEVYLSSKDCSFKDKLDKYTIKYKDECKQCTRQYDVFSKEDVDISLFVVKEEFTTEEEKVAARLLNRGVEKGVISESERKGLRQYGIGYECPYTLHQIILIVDGKEIAYHEVIDIEMDEDDDVGSFYMYTRKVKKNSKKIPLQLTESIKKGIMKKDAVYNWTDAYNVIKSKNEIISWSKE